MSAKTVTLWIVGGALVLAGGAYAAGYALAGENTPRNASVSGVPIGGLTSDAAVAKLQFELEPRLTRPLTVTAGAERLTTTAAELGLGVDYSASVAGAGAGRIPGNPEARRRQGVRR